LQKIFNEDVFFISNITRKLDRFYQQKIVKDQYPMLISLQELIIERKNYRVDTCYHVMEKDSSRIQTNKDMKVFPNFLEKVIVRFKKEVYASHFYSDEISSVIFGRRS